MDDLMLEAKLDEFTTLMVAPIDPQTYVEHVECDSLGGSIGYFVVRSSKGCNKPRFEVLAKSPTFEAAKEIFDMIIEPIKSRVLIKNL